MIGYFNKIYDIYQGNLCLHNKNIKPQFWYFEELKNQKS